MYFLLYLSYFSTSNFQFSHYALAHGLTHLVSCHLFIYLSLHSLSRLTRPKTKIILIPFSSNILRHLFPELLSVHPRAFESSDGSKQ